MRRSLVPVFVCLMVALVGCSSVTTARVPVTAMVATRNPTPAPTSIPLPTETPSPMPKPTSRPASRHEAASAYLSVAGAFNRSIDSLTARYGSTSDGMGQRRLQALAARAALDFIVGVRRIRFPEASAGAAKALIRQTTVYMQAARMASKASDEAVLRLFLLDASKAQTASSRLAAELRKDLGLRRPPAASKGRSGRRF